MCKYTTFRMSHRDSNDSLEVPILSEHPYFLVSLGKTSRVEVISMRVVHKVESFQRVALLIPEIERIFFSQANGMFNLMKSLII